MTATEGTMGSLEAVGFRLIRQKPIAVGGMAVVYHALAPRAFEGKTGGLLSEVAIKVLRADLPPNARDEIERRFASEARFLQALGRSPGVIQLVARGTWGGAPALVLEWCPLGNLQDRWEVLRQNPQTIPGLFRGILDGLEASHRAGLIHRDLKPQNILLRADGTPALADFGIARDDIGHGTRADTDLGTRSFMAPEQFGGMPGRADARSDVFSVACILFWLIGGTHPYPEVVKLGRSYEELRDGLARPAAFLESENAALFEVLRRALAIDPSQRPDNADALHRELEAVWSRHLGVATGPPSSVRIGSGTAPPVLLTVLAPAKATLVRPPNDCAVIGRGPTSVHLRIDSPAVSSEHVLLSVLGDGRVLVADLSSSNGTFLVTSDQNIGSHIERIERTYVDPPFTLRLGSRDAVSLRVSRSEREEGASSDE